MSHPEFNEPDASSEYEPVKPLPRMNIDQWVETLRRADRSLYNMMALEVWSIAKTMDDLTPGFWNCFMTNRRLALKQLIQQREQQKEAQRSTNNKASQPEKESEE